MGIHPFIHKSALINVQTYVNFLGVQQPKYIQKNESVREKRLVYPLEGKMYQKQCAGLDSQQHEKTCFSIAAYHCQACKEVFCSGRSLKRHVLKTRIQDATKLPYLCAVCAEGFLTKDKLKVH